MVGSIVQDCDEDAGVNDAQIRSTLRKVHQAAGRGSGDDDIVTQWSKAVHLVPSMIRRKIVACKADVAKYTKV